MSHDTRWAVIPTPVSAEIWAAVREQPDTTTGWSLDGTLKLVKWDGDIPAVLSGVTVYDEAGIREVLSGSNWTPPDPPPEDP